VDRAQAIPLLLALCPSLDELAADRALDSAVTTSQAAPVHGPIWVAWNAARGFTVQPAPDWYNPALAEVLHAGLRPALAAAAAVPQLPGFRPALVIAGLARRLARAALEFAFTLGCELPGPPGQAPAEALAGAAARVLSGAGIPAAAVVSYGPENVAVPAAAWASGHLTEAGLRVSGRLRVHRGQYWCLCGASSCAQSPGRPVPDPAPASATETLDRDPRSVGRPPRRLPPRRRPRPPGTASTQARAPQPGTAGQPGYQQGDRVRLVACTDEHTRLRPGDLGTVGFVDSLGTVHVAWDSGARLGMIAAAGDIIVSATEPEAEPGR
jgi:hypothetical protein